VLRRLMTVAVLVGASLAGLTPARAADSTTIYTLQIGDLSPRLAGQPTDFAAVLATGTTPLAGEPLTLWLKPYGASAFSVAGHATTDADGYAVAWSTLASNAAVKWTFDGDGAYPASESAPYVVQISPRVTRHVNDRTLRRGQRLVVRGRSIPAKPGCTVKLWRGELRPLVQGPKPVRLAVSTVRADGSYRLVHRFHRKMRMRIAVTVSACAGNARGLSSYVGIRVR
jgi:hypothetical protein